MTQRNHTSPTANVSGSHPQPHSKLHMHIFRPDGRYRQGFISILLLIMILLSPIGSTPGHAVDPLPPPALLTPADVSTVTVAEAPPLAIPEFSWAEVPGAKQYRLQLSLGDIGFTPANIKVDKQTPNTTFTPASATNFSDGVWYWRVRVESPTPVSNWSDIWSFTKQWATPTNLPTLDNPPNGATIDFYDKPVFSWSAVTGAARYRFEVSTDSTNWGTLKFDLRPLVTTIQPITKLANGTYYWRVIPIDPGAHEGTPSEVYTFTTDYNPVPILLEPEDNAEPTFTPTFRWTAVRGADFYRLEYTTDPSFMSGIIFIETHNIAYTPTSTLQNDVNYYWRVRVHSGSSISDWTSSRTFIKRWYIKPVLLTPVNNYQHVRFPLLSWTPVPGAGYYKVEISELSNFGVISASVDTANTLWEPNNITAGGLPKTWYWRVTPYDGDGRAGLASDMSSYANYNDSISPHLVYPFFYYPPDTYSGFPGVTTNPHEDRTVPLPIFIWHRVYAYPSGQVYAEAYRLEVDDDPLFGSVNWSVDTQNTSVTPQAGEFTPLPNTDYFWHVCTLNGGCDEVSGWSQRWKTRFDLTRGLTPTGGAYPTLIRPTNGFEFAEATPLLEWFPLSGAASYDVQISLDESFSTIVDTATVSYPAYAPTQSLAQRSLGNLVFGVYYWRVSETGTGSWSEVRRFQISAQSQWQNTRTLGATTNQLQIGSDPAGEIGLADPDYDLTDLQAAQSSSNWYFGFHVPSTTDTNVTYALYVDLDHKSASGATFDAKGYNVTTIPAYRPEYAIYILQESGAFSASKVHLYKWTGSGWDTVQALGSIGGALDLDGNYVEISVPNTAIGYQDTTGSYALSLFSLPAGSGGPQDSVPTDPNVPGSGPISRFANVTERLNLVMPPNDAGVDPTTYSSIQPFFWDWPFLAPWSGAYLRVYLDQLFTSPVPNNQGSASLESTNAYFERTFHAFDDDFSGDNTYYWRIQPKYRTPALVNGAWSQGYRFERKGFVPQNLQTSVTFATPTFSWDMVEGAQYYDLQVSTDPGFGGFRPIDISTKLNSYTHGGTLAKATYYWRVRAHRWGGNSVTNSWTANHTFTLALPTPTGLNHAPFGVVGRAPTLCWDPLIENSPVTGDPVLAAYKYHVLVSIEPGLTSEYDKVDTEQSCWTPTKGYADGQYYWSVAMWDGDGKMGDYAPTQTFTKQYPISTLVSPLSGTTLGSTPTFVWTPVDGAARYKLEVSLFDNFGTPEDSPETDNTRYTPQKTYTLFKTYYWRVAIVDADGNRGPWNTATIILDLPYHAFLPLTRK